MAGVAIDVKRKLIGHRSGGRFAIPFERDSWHLFAVGNITLLEMTGPTFINLLCRSLPRFKCQDYIPFAGHQWRLEFRFGLFGMMALHATHDRFTIGSMRVQGVTSMIKGDLALLGLTVFTQGEHFWECGVPGGRR